MNIKKPAPLREALCCAASYGWAVYPASKNKRPRTPNGHNAASTDPESIRAMWKDYGGPLVGIRTGEASNLAVLDIDRQHNGTVWWLENRHRLPTTRTHRTRSGGLHLFFTHSPGLRNSTAHIAAGIDVRAEGGSIIYWPAAGLPVLCDAPLAAWPKWLVAPPKPASAHSTLPTFSGGASARRYAEAAMKNAIRDVATAPSGTRNQTLNTATYSLARLLHMGAGTAGEIARAMAYAGLAAGLDASEVERTITSALAARGDHT